MEDEKAYDVIIAGAGIAGAIAATAAAKSGVKTLLLDRNSSEEVGKKTNWGWVCGDAVAKSHVDYLAEELDIRLAEPELDHKVDGVYVLSPDLESKLMFEGEGFTLDRPKLAKKLLSEAQHAGAEYRPGYEVEGPIISSERIEGVFGKNDKKQEFRIKGKIVIDALGMASTLRRRLSNNKYIEREISTDDIEPTGRYILTFEQAETDTNFYDPKNALIHLNQELAPGGYGWVFPKSNNRVNIGVGIGQKSLEKHNKTLGRSDTLHKLIDDYIAYNKVIKNTRIDTSDGNGKGYWSISVRRHQHSLVYANYMGAGDSMSMANPISGGGIGPAMIGGVLAGKIAGEAIAANDINMNFLWHYNTQFNELYGRKSAALEIFRVYMQSLNNDRINYGIRHFITPDEAKELAYSGIVPEVSILGAAQKLISGLSNVNAFKDFIYIVRKMKRVTELYDKYPKEPSGFDAWSNAIYLEIEEVKKRFKPNSA
ncbi:MAG: geranylgeranyl reductase family protein [Candidatus Micrarchaeaceae archaeon]